MMFGDCLVLRQTRHGSASLTGASPTMTVDYPVQPGVAERRQEQVVGFLALRASTMVLSFEGGDLEGRAARPAAIGRSQGPEGLGGGQAGGADGGQQPGEGADENSGNQPSG